MATRRVLVAARTQTAYGHDVERGALTYIHQRTDWESDINGLDLGNASQTPRGWHGAILQAAPEVTEQFAAEGVAVVNVADHLERCLAFPSVFTDHREVGRLAAEHFLARGFRSMAFIGDEAWYTHRRFEGFSDALQGRIPGPVNSRIAPSGSGSSEQVGQWLKELPRPVAVLAGYDAWGKVIVRLCSRLKLRVPRDVAVLGVDNDKTLCISCRPVLSSVAVDAWRIGYEAAAMLDRLLRGEQAPAGAVMVPPLEVIERASTRTIADPDGVLDVVIQTIHRTIDRPVSVSDLAREAGVSVRTIELRCRKLLGHGPAEVIQLARMERAKQLLRETDLNLQVVAADTGFRGTPHLRMAFQRRLHMSPLTYRDRMRDANRIIGPPRPTHS